MIIETWFLFIRNFRLFPWLLDKTVVNRGQRLGIHDRICKLRINLSCWHDAVKTDHNQKIFLYLIEHKLHEDGFLICLGIALHVQDLGKLIILLPSSHKHLEIFLDYCLWKVGNFPMAMQLCCNECMQNLVFLKSVWSKRGYFFFTFQRAVHLKEASPSCFLHATLSMLVFLNHRNIEP